MLITVKFWSGLQWDIVCDAVPASGMHNWTFLKKFLLNSHVNVLWIMTSVLSVLIIFIAAEMLCLCKALIIPLSTLQLDPFYASVILFVGRAWDAITDPTVGFLVSRTPWTRFGRMMPWYLIFFFLF